MDEFVKQIDAIARNDDVECMVLIAKLKDVGKATPVAVAMKGDVEDVGLMLMNAFEVHPTLLPIVLATLETMRETRINVVSDE